ncbi:MULTISPECIES: WecB/TagA/CpsF family glycosyltransferase [unclassified Paenibacillus]|uniref:WecB/TagA/CpsF family glycosyltransferase n=1 Tax=unclassified Paenibacillus TaxID=185978 RepID=UPI0027859CD0|nr:MULTISPECIES: WecB/TagA/CpsF family glycosyltransferase [unclassified Paenibacillus]MDQ0902967.1 N-acetylglucosaminyldiphosphoundecaprenol N-acetyl-beta-D-mannosaminyltransferase [Paenibacillus sp. V4I7]MDQ0918557.1 N-acetylglucosaminyldiphosphoundecaprenol N-acetyl-beta-D-mannosaminyltransferase [Paenibacillus sp. V4I5]
MSSTSTTIQSKVASANAIPKVRIYGVPISKMSMDQTVAYLTNAIEQRQPHQVITANPIMVMAAQDDPAYLSMMQRAELIVPDGTGVVWAAKYVGEPVVERVPGYDLIHELMKVGESKGWKVYLLGASNEVIQAAAEKLRTAYPRVKLVGVRDGYFKDEQDAEVIQDIVDAAPDLLFVGRSAANQEPWIGKYKQQIGVPVMMGVGGSFDVLSGKLKRAPVLFQKLRLEWFYRLMQEPWRYKRMLLLPKFALKVMRDKEKVTKP